jgi:hypothetical protein
LSLKNKMCIHIESYRVQLCFNNKDVIIIIIGNSTIALLLGLGRFFSSLILFTVGRTRGTEGSIYRKAATHTQDNTNAE